MIVCRKNTYIKKHENNFVQNTNQKNTNILSKNKKVDYSSPAVPDFDRIQNVL